MTNFWQIFTRDFGIRPYFLIRKSYEKIGIDCYEIDEVQAQAFLTLPILSNPILSSPGPSAACISICKAIGPLALKGLSDDQVQLFRIATNLLNLHPYDLEEGEDKDDDDDDRVESDAETSEKPISPSQATAETADNNGDNQTEENELVTQGNASYTKPKGKHSGKNGLATDVKKDKMRIEPQLMILGCGEFMAYDDPCG